MQNRRLEEKNQALTNELFIKNKEINKEYIEIFEAAKESPTLLNDALDADPTG